MRSARALFGLALLAAVAPANAQVGPAPAATFPETPEATAPPEQPAPTPSAAPTTDPAPPPGPVQPPPPASAPTPAAPAPIAAVRAPRAPAPDEPATDPAPPRKLFATFGLGPGLFSAESGAIDDRRTFGGTSVSGQLALASRINPGLALGGAYFHDFVFGLTAEDSTIDGDEPSIDEVRFSMSILGFFSDIHLSGNAGAHLQFLIGLANLSVGQSGRSSDVPDPSGLAVALGGGYDFRLGQNGSIGALARLIYAPLSVNEGQGTDVEIFVPSLLLTTTLY